MKIVFFLSLFCDVVYPSFQYCCKKCSSVPAYIPTISIQNVLTENKRWLLTLVFACLCCCDARTLIKERGRLSFQDTSEEVAQLIEDDGEGEMPAGWEMQVAPTGRKFFINHADRTTTWVSSQFNRMSDCWMKTFGAYWMKFIGTKHWHEMLQIKMWVFFAFRQFWTTIF